MEQGTLSLAEAAARQLVLVRAIEDVDHQGKLLGEAEREQVEREALEASRAAHGGSVDFGAYLQERARRFLTIVEKRNPRIALLQQGEPWRHLVMAAVPLLACVFGAAVDRIDNPHQVNMLSPPLLGVLAWNLAIYVLLLVSFVLPHRARSRPPWVQRWLAGAQRVGAGRLRSDIFVRFHAHWLQATGAQEGLWWKQLLHLCAAGWALGLAFSIVLGGIVREYRVGWESTLLGVGQVHAFLSALFAPVVALLPFDPFTVADLQRMAFRSGAAIGVDEARRWIWMYVALLALVVVVPRLVLAAGAAWARGRHGRSIRIDLRDPYFVQLLARVSPARVTISLVAGEGPGRDAVLSMLRQVADPAPRDAGPWIVLSTARGDVLRVYDVPHGFRPPAPTVTAQAGAPGSAAQAWLQDLLGRFKAAPRPQERDAVQATLADTDLMLLVPQANQGLQDAARLLHWVGQPALVLAPGESDDCGATLQRLGVTAEVLPLVRCTAHWLCDPLLLDAAAARIAPSKRAGFERLAATWKDRNAVRFGEAMRLLASELVRAARDAEEVGSAPLGLRQLVNAADRDVAQRARDAARSTLLQRVRGGESAVLAELVQLHRAGAPVAPLASERLEQGFTEQNTLDTPQAGIAGAATGAAMGAGIDLLTGGLTLGAAAALGAVIGGGAAYAAAAWKNRGAPGGPPQVQLGDELLQALTETLLLAYLAVAHRTVPAGGPPGAWRSEVVAAVEARRDALVPLWQQARSGADAGTATVSLARELEDLARALLARLQPA